MVMILVARVYGMVERAAVVPRFTQAGCTSIKAFQESHI
jgi:hypothetical protein